MSPGLMIVSLFLLSLVSSSSSSASPVGSQSIPRYDDHHPADYAVELNVANFDQVLTDTPASYAVVEFYAHWCPACRNYKPHYEKVAKLFNGADAVHPGIILMTRVDCALKDNHSCDALGDGLLKYDPIQHNRAIKNTQRIMINRRNLWPWVNEEEDLVSGVRPEVNTDICNRFSVSHYPMLFWGPPSKFVSGGGDGKQDKSEIRSIDNGRTADRLLNWINMKLESTYGLDDVRFKNEQLQSNVSDPGQIARAVYNVEEATSIAFDIIRDKMIKYSDIQSWFSESWTSWLLSFSRPTTNVEEK